MMVMSGVGRSGDHATVYNNSFMRLCLSSAAAMFIGLPMQQHVTYAQQLYPVSGGRAVRKRLLYQTR